MPFLNSEGKCINCQKDQYFNVETKLCVSCLNFNPLLHICEAPKYNLTNIAAANKIILPPNSKIDVLNPKKGDLVCPATKPFYNGLICINCPNTFDLAKNNCTTCPEGSIFNATENICKKSAVQVTNPNNLKKLLLP